MFLTHGTLFPIPKNMSYTSREYCSTMPPEVNSFGIWRLRAAGLKPYPIPTLEFQMFVIFFFTQLFQLMLKPFRLPKFTSQLLAGLILGPTMLGRLEIVQDYMFSVNNQEEIGMLGTLGYSFFMFLSGVKIDMGMINSRTMGTKPLWTGTACVLLPLIVGTLYQSRLTKPEFGLTRRQASELPYAIAVHCLSPFPVISSLLEELKMIGSEIGRFSLSAALVSEIYNIFLSVSFSLMTILKAKGFTYAFIATVSTVGYILLVVFVFRPAMFRIIRQTPEGRPVKNSYLGLIIILMLASGLLSTCFGQSFLFGPLILGMAIPDGPPLGTAIIDKLHLFVFDIYLPIFVTTSLLRADFSHLRYNFKDKFIKANQSVIAVTFLTKFLGCMIPPLLCKMPLADTLAIALIMCSKGIVQLANFTFARDKELTSETAFTLDVGSILLASIILPLAVKLLNPTKKFTNYEKRNIMYSSPNSELRVLVCIHRPENISGIINLLDVSCSDTRSALSVYALHLIELIGRASPVLLSHQWERKSPSHLLSYSEKVIYHLNKFEKRNKGIVSLNSFTIISPSKSMDEDICLMALDNRTTIIILPFHRRWYTNGSIESDDNTIRAINCSVLEIAPCSVGILVDRGISRRASMVAPESYYSVAVVFLGGKDDREALSLGKRMIGEKKSIRLTVIILAAIDEFGDVYEKMLDMEVMRDLKFSKNAGFECIRFVEKRVNDGPESAMVLRSMAAEYDLIMVGREHDANSPQTSGLSEWSEFPELGTIGDLLASLDFYCKASVLVVQQQ